MKQIHYLTGMPRSGSTLLCNILCQNPEFYASGTSPVLSIVNSAKLTWSNAPEVKNQIDDEKQLYFERFRNVANGIIQNWYAVKDEPVIFDKCRGWTISHQLLRSVVDGPKFIVMVRDLRDIVASVVRRSMQTSLYDNTAVNTLDGQITHILSQQGIAGGPMRGIGDLLLRGDLKNVCIVKYENLCKNAELVMRGLYKFLGKPYYEHNFQDIKKAHNENDAMWMYTFPHEGTGKVTECKEGGWRDVISEELAKQIENTHKWYFNKFGYNYDKET